MTTYSFTAFSEADLLAGTGDSNVGVGDTFTMPDFATATMIVTDDDAYLSGDSWNNEQANDSTYQTALIQDENGNELGNGGQIYAEQYFWVSDQNGNWYVMVEIEQEGGSGDYFAFYNSGGYTTPDEGAVLTVHSTCNVTCDWIQYCTLDGGEMPADLGSISGAVFTDTDGDNTQLNATGEEDGQAGVTVKLYMWNGSKAVLVETTTTDANGDYSFGDLSGGWYYVKFTKPDGTDFVQKDVGSDATDSDVNSDGYTSWTWLNAGENKVDVDAGVKEAPAVINGRFTYDADSNDNEWNDETGSWDAGVEGQTVQLLDLNGNVVAETVTDAYGNYSFTVAAGDYQVKFPSLDGYEFSAKDSGVEEHFDSDADANGLTDVISVGAGECVYDIDAGIKESTNLAPDAIDDFFVTDEETAVSGNVLDNDSDPDGDPISVVAVEGGNVGEAFQVTTANGYTGSVTLNADGSFSFTPDDNFQAMAAGEVDSFQLDYTIADEPNVASKTNLLFVLDISNSTTGTTGQDSDVFVGADVGDVNGDGLSNTVLDAEIAAVVSSINKLLADGVDPSMVDVGIVTFSGVVDASQFTAYNLPTEDATDVGTWSLDEAALIQALTDIQSGGWTNYEAGLQEAEGWLSANADAGEANKVIFLSDGRPVITKVWNEHSQSWDEVLQDASVYGDEVARISNDFGAEIHAIGVGANSDLAYLNDLDNTDGAIQVLNSNDLTIAIEDASAMPKMDTATITVTINGLNDLADGDEAATVEEGSGATALADNALANTDDPDGGTPVIESLDGVALNGGSASAAGDNGGVFTFNADGSVSFDTNGEFSLLDEGETAVTSVTYTVSDGQGGSVQSTYTVTVTGTENDPIVDALDDFLSVLSTETADAAPDGNVLDNDISSDAALEVVEVNGDAQNVAAQVAGDNGGVVTINEDGTYEFSANGEFDDLKRGETRETDFTYSVTDGISGSGQQKQNIVFVVDVSGSTSPAEFAGTPVGDQNGDGVENSVLDAEIAAYKALSAEIASKGIDPNAVDIGLVIFSGNQGSDQTGASQIVGTFKPGSSALEDALNGLTDGGFTNFEAPMQQTINWFESVSADQSDNNVVYFLSDGMQNRGGEWVDEVAQLEASYDASIVAIGVGANAVLEELNTVDNTGGAEIVTSTDALTAALIEGVTYDASVDDTATLHVTVTGVNHGPDAVDDAIAIDEDGSVSPADLNILANDSDYDGDALTVSAIENGAVGSPFAVVTAGGVTVMVTVAADGGLSFDTNGLFDDLAVGESDSFTLNYTADDGFGGTDTATVTVTINGLNEPPVAEDDAIAIDESGIIDLPGGDGVQSLNILTNDSDPNGDNLTIAAVAGGLVGVAFSVTTAGGKVVEATVNANGDLLFNTAGQFDDLGLGETDSFSFAYTVDDGNGGQDDAVVTVTINGENEPPTATNNAAVTDEETAVSGNVLTDDDGFGVDADPNGDTLTVTAVSFGNLGEATSVTTTSGNYTGVLTVDATGAYTFTPDAALDALAVGDVETVTFDYTISDGNGETDTASVTITINGLNEPPVAGDDAVTIDEDGSIGGDTGTAVLNVLTNDSDPNGDDLTITSVGGAAAGTPVTVTTANGVVTTVTITETGEVLFNTNGQFDSMPVGATDSFTVDYTISDGNGGTDTASVTVTIEGLNEPPVAEDDAITIGENGLIGSGDTATAALNILDNDSDPNGDALTVASVEGQAAGTPVTVTTTGGRVVDVTILADGTVEFDTAGDFADLNDGESDSFTLNYVADDGNGGQDDANVTITVNGEGATGGDLNLNIVFLVDSSGSAWIEGTVDASIFDGYDTSAFEASPGDGVVNVDMNNDGITNSDVDASLFLAYQYQKALAASGLTASVDIGVAGFSFNTSAGNSYEFVDDGTTNADNFVFSETDDLITAFDNGLDAGGNFATLNGAFAGANQFFATADQTGDGTEMNLVYILSQGTGAPNVPYTDSDPLILEATELFADNGATVQLASVGDTATGSTFDSAIGNILNTVIGNVGSVIGSVDATVDMTASGDLQDFLNNELTQLSDPLA